MRKKLVGFTFLTKLVVWRLLGFWNVVLGRYPGDNFYVTLITRFFFDRFSNGSHRWLKEDKIRRKKWQISRDTFLGTAKIEIFILKVHEKFAENVLNSWLYGTSFFASNEYKIVVLTLGILINIFKIFISFYLHWYYVGA